MKDCKWIVYTLSHSLVYTGWFVIGSNNGSALNSLFNNQRVDVSVSQSVGAGGGYRLTSWCNIVISLFVYKCPISSFYFLNLISTYTHFYARTVFVFFLFLFLFMFELTISNHIIYTVSSFFITSFFFLISYIEGA